MLDYFEHEPKKSSRSYYINMLIFFKDKLEFIHKYISISMTQINTY